MVKFFRKKKSRCKDKLEEQGEPPTEGPGAADATTSSSDIPPENQQQEQKLLPDDPVKRTGIYDLIPSRNNSSYRSTDNDNNSQSVRLNLEHGENNITLLNHNDDPSYYYCYSRESRASTSKKLLIISTEYIQLVAQECGDLSINDVDLNSTEGHEIQNTEQESNNDNSDSNFETVVENSQPIENQIVQTCQNQNNNNNNNNSELESSERKKEKSDSENDDDSSSLLEYIQCKLQEDSLPPFCPQVYIIEKEGNKKNPAPAPARGRFASFRADLPSQYQAVDTKTPVTESDESMKIISVPAYRRGPKRKILVIKREEEREPRDREMEQLGLYMDARNRRDNNKALAVLEKIRTDQSSSSVLSTFQARERHYGRKHLLAWQAAISMPRSKKAPFETAIPVAATRYLKTDMSKWELVRRYIIKLFRCGGSGLYVSEVLTQYSIDKFNMKYNIMKNIEFRPGFGLKRRESLFSSSSPKMIDHLNHDRELEHTHKRKKTEDDIVKTTDEIPPKNMLKEKDKEKNKQKDKDKEKEKAEKEKETEKESKNKKQKDVSTHSPLKKTEKEEKVKFKNNSQPLNPPVQNNSPSQKDADPKAITVIKQATTATPYTTNTTTANATMPNKDLRNVNSGAIKNPLKPTRSTKSKVEELFKMNTGSGGKQRYREKNQGTEIGQNPNPPESNPKKEIEKNQLPKPNSSDSKQVGNPVKKVENVNATRRKTITSSFYDTPTNPNTNTKTSANTKSKDVKEMKNGDKNQDLSKKKEK